MHTNTHPQQPTLLSVLAPMDATTFAHLTNPASDPGLVVAPSPTHGQPAVAVAVPSVANIEAALDAHILDGTSPCDLIRALYHPFADDSHITLEPGQGKQRRTYAYHIDALGIECPRLSTKAVAEHLHNTAQRLSVYAVGTRAPAGSPVFAINLNQWSDRRSIAATDAATLRAAINTVHRCGHDRAIHTDLAYTPTDLIPHIRAAQALLSQQALGAANTAQQAHALITAVEDLRAAATVALRSSTSAHDYRYCSSTITIDLDTATITMIDHKDIATTGHEKLAQQARQQSITAVLNTLLQRHPVLSQLPPTTTLELSGEMHYLHAVVQVGKDAQQRYATFEPHNANSLFGLFHDHTVLPQHAWTLHIHQRSRSRQTWNLQGTTLAHGLLNAALHEKERASMLLTDLLIDMMASEDEQPSITLTRAQ